MALVKRVDFASALNIPDGTIRSKISRRQLCCNKKGLLDTENPKNFAYLLEVNGGNQSVFDEFDTASNSKTKLSKKSIAPTKNETKVSIKEKNVKSVDKNDVKSKKTDFEEVNDSNGSVNLLHGENTKEKLEKKEPKLTAEERKIQAEYKKHNLELLNLDKRKREAEVKLVERNAELKQWELEKKAGNTLPLDMIEKVVGINYKAVFKSIHSQAKNIAMVMVQQLGGSKEDLNGIMIELESILDKTVKDAEKKSAVDIEKLIDEYSEIRSRGERKV